MNGLIQYYQDLEAEEEKDQKPAAWPNERGNQGNDHHSNSSSKNGNQRVPQLQQPEPALQAPPNNQPVMAAQPQAQAQAQAQVQAPAHVPFALSPAHDYKQANNATLYCKAIAPLIKKYDGDTGKLQQFLEPVTARARQHNWAAILANPQHGQREPKSPH